VIHLGQILGTVNSGVLRIVSLRAIRSAGATRRNQSLPAREAREAVVVLGAVAGGVRREPALVQAISPRACTVIAGLDGGLAFAESEKTKMAHLLLRYPGFPIVVRGRALVSAVRPRRQGGAAGGYSSPGRYSAAPRVRRVRDGGQQLQRRPGW
jgi:hypothetical protein